jgi:hypothetical protein
MRRLEGESEDPEDDLELESEDLDLEDDGDLDLKLFLPPRPRPLEPESFPRLAPRPPRAPLPRPPREVSEKPLKGDIISGTVGLPVIFPLIVPDTGANGSIFICPSVILYTKSIDIKFLSHAILENTSAHPKQKNLTRAEVPYSNPSIAKFRQSPHELPFP